MGLFPHSEKGQCAARDVFCHAVLACSAFNGPEPSVRHFDSSQSEAHISEKQDAFNWFHNKNSPSLSRSRFEILPTQTISGRPCLIVRRHRTGVWRQSSSMMHSAQNCTGIQKAIDISEIACSSKASQYLHATWRLGMNSFLLLFKAFPRLRGPSSLQCNGNGNYFTENEAVGAYIIHIMQRLMRGAHLLSTIRLQDVTLT